MNVSREQIKTIHTLKGKLALSDEEYRAMLAGFDKASSKELSFNQARLLISQLADKAASIGQWKPSRKSPSRTKKEKVSQRRRGSIGRAPIEMATPAQVNAIDAMWAEVSRIKDDPDARRRALDLFIHRHFRRGGLMMIEAEMVPRVMHTLEKMGATRP